MTIVLDTPYQSRFAEAQLVKRRRLAEAKYPSAP